MGVEKGACFLVNGVLETLLCRRRSWKIADATGSYIVLSEGIHQAFANTGCVCQL